MNKDQLLKTLEGIVTNQELQLTESMHAINSIRLALDELESEISTRGDDIGNALEDLISEIEAYGIEPKIKTNDHVIIKPVNRDFIGNKPNYNVNSVIDFGQFNGMAIAAVLTGNPEYLKWMMTNHPGTFRPDEDLKKQILDITSRRRQRTPSRFWGGDDNDYWDHDYDSSGEWGSW